MCYSLASCPCYLYLHFLKFTTFHAQDIAAWLFLQQLLAFDRFSCLSEFNFPTLNDGVYVILC